MIQMPVLGGSFETPLVVFTLRGNDRSTAVINALRLKTKANAECLIFNSVEEVRDYFSNGVSPSSAVVLLDSNFQKKRFHPTCRNRSSQMKTPEWTMGAQWIVIIGDNCNNESRQRDCVDQVFAFFWRNFYRRLNQGQFPWGDGRANEQPPKPVSVLTTVVETISKLNDGPNLAAAIADQKFALELPKDSKISWIRVSDRPLISQAEILKKTIEALRLFEEVCNVLVRNNKSVQQLLLAGVDLPTNSRIAEMYLFPKVSRFSVGRPDLHFTGENQFPFASEIDEMPGGMPELVHIDNVYGINQERWKQAFDWLCEKGKLVFLVSHQWSKCYIPETVWLVDHLQSLRYPVEILTTDRIEEIDFRSDGLYLNDEKIGTIWRQFPIFETKDQLEKVVMASFDGCVRLFPEFAHFGNKAWFSIFRSHEEFYRKELDSETFDILDRVLPHSYIVGAGNKDPFPMNVNGIQIGSIDDLQNLSQAKRDRLVLKICGANNLAARSYGVLMGIGINDRLWWEWIRHRINSKQPFVVQARLESGTARIPVMNIKTGYPEIFSCRILARPWSFNGELVSVHGCAVPSHLYKVHGMVDMAVVPFAIQ